MGVSSPGSGAGDSSAGAAGAVCAGCGNFISDRYYLLAVDRQWHSPCLKCCECKLPLDTELTCFSRDGNIYCKDDYYRLFAIKRCCRCQTGISANELVMRAKEQVFHIHCFTCASCGVPLSKGDTYGMRNGLVYCHPHYDLLLAHDPYCGEPDTLFRAGASPAEYFGSGNVNPITGVQKGRPRKRKLQTPPDASPGSEIGISLRMTSGALDLVHPGELSSSMESLTYDGSLPNSPNQQQAQNARNKRMRTSFKHHQLRTMKSYFAINQNPDAKDLKQLAQKTGLSKRVLQVWFQNARAKWRRNIMRQEGLGGLPPSTPGGPGSSNSSLDCPASALLDASSHSMEDHQMHHGPAYSDLY